MEFGKESWRSYEQGISREWLLTNGIGGFASSTVIGANSRRYHGLLVASLRPPVERHLFLSKINEVLHTGGRSLEFYSHEAGGSVMEGFKYQQRFLYDPLPVFIYNIGDIQIEKTICMVYGKNTTVIVYRVRNGEGDASLELLPLVNFRDYHHTSSRWHMQFTRLSDREDVTVKPYGLETDLHLYCSEGIFQPMEDTWFMNMCYAQEKERGLDAAEDHYIPGSFTIHLKSREEKTITLTATIEKDMEPVDGREIIESEKRRLRRLREKAGYADDFADALVTAADNFITYRQSTDAGTIIAGYPWFTDWGRDTMIALPGLTLATRRYEDAEQILSTFSRYVKYGLVPNVFPDEGQEPSYNSVDAALWYFEAVAQYLRHTGGLDFVMDKLYPSLKQIADAFMGGTLFDIKMDSDGLISAGSEMTQLTWMDAKVGNWVVTPRHGKAVEINALWYNALMVMDRLEKCLPAGESRYGKTAETVKKNFLLSFWNEDGQYLYDVVRSGFKDARIRPNQIFAISLSHPILTGDKARKTVDVVWKNLYTSYGLRSLSPCDAEYRGVYSGDVWSRDGAYHQGTVWTWPIGAFITAFARVYANEHGRADRIQEFMAPFRDHLKDACLGNISEIFDGDEPLTPRGCFAQAWSVGEVLRAYVEEVLKNRSGNG